MPKWNKLVEASIVGFLHSNNKQLQRNYKYLQTLTSKTTLERVIQILVAALLRIDPIEVQGSNPIVSKGEKNTNVDPKLHEETTNVPSTTLNP
jgi:hypothetical protein